MSKRNYTRLCIMLLAYNQDKDHLKIHLRSCTEADSREVAPGVIMVFDAQGNVMGIDIQSASTRVDLTQVRTQSLPSAATTGISDELIRQSESILRSLEGRNHSDSVDLLREDRIR